MVSNKFLSSTKGFFVIFIFVIIVEIIILQFVVNKQEKIMPKKKEIKHKIQFKTIESKPKPEPKLVEATITKPKPKPKTKPTKKQLALAKQRKELKAKRLKEKKDKDERLKKERLKKERLKKKEEQRIKNKELKKKREEELKKKKEQEEKDRLARLAEKERRRIDGIRTSFINNIRSEMSKYQKYPLISKARKEEGIVVISFRIDKAGIITNIKVKSSSGYKRLDKAALKIFRHMGTTFTIPEDIKEDYMDLTIPISFKLK